VQGSVSRGILGGRICPIEEEVLQMLRVTMLKGLGRSDGTRRGGTCGKYK